MIRYSQFNDFKPLKDEVPYFPITEARNIAGRARSLLRINKRTEDDVQAIATDASLVMEAYFDHEKEEKLEEIKKHVKGGVVIDIGAQVGNMSVAYSLFAKNVLNYGIIKNKFQFVPFATPLYYSHAKISLLSK
jgi:hypothetical protein